MALKNYLIDCKPLKKPNFLLDVIYRREDAVKMTNDEFIAFAEETFDQLLPVYDVIIGNKLKERNLALRSFY